ncbi:MAG: ribosome maturation factor [Ginsengibacter sp.]
MNSEIHSKRLGEYLDGLLSDSKTEFLVDVKMAPGNQIKVLLDDDNGITIQRCAQVNKALYKYIEEAGLFGDSNFSIEVSSPGLDEPLKLLRQYKKNIGRSVEVSSIDGSSVEGQLTEVDESGIVIASPRKKTKENRVETQLLTILFKQIKHTKVLITF